MHQTTRCVHHPEPPLDGFRSLSVPTYRASTIVFDSASEYYQRKDRGPDGYSYGMNGTPTTRVFERQISLLHGGAHTVALPSGQAAIAAVILSLLKSGDHILLPDSVYPPVKTLCAQLAVMMNLTFDRYDPVQTEALATKITDRTRLIWTESPGSSTLEIQDIPAIVSLAHQRGILVGCDNTWATPLLFRPIEHGVDFVVEAVTKYIGGHSDLLMGTVTTDSDDLYVSLKKTIGMLGYAVSPDDCALALRGIETLPLRVRHSGETAQRLSERIRRHYPAFEVLNPALAGACGHELWQRDFSGGSGVFSVVLRDVSPERLDGALKGLGVFAIGASWGGTHSLLAPMVVANEVGSQRFRPEDIILRVNIGLEEEQDLWNDLSRILSRLSA
ncbi:aminotransferase class V-fold PLP-dependent enzyme [Martelella alba]|uniref:Aminotransferase class V-fold PLP-dependent enzyme n=2 Tax=Martelella alba TaxID=2590451 RepID=A0ABY2SLW8_9HYPH|nr:aminotransferase class V-fold PLP-dependent enzyme [Martelella alba]